MTPSIRFVVCSYNIWTNMRWPERQPAYIASHNCIAPTSSACKKCSRRAARCWMKHSRRRSISRLDAGGQHLQEGNIYWNTDMFELLTYGAEPIEIIEEYRRLFWVRLRFRQASDQTVFVSTAHYTWPGHPREGALGQNIRIPSDHKPVMATYRL